MIRLDATTRKLQAVLSGAVTTNQLPCLVSYSDKTSADYVGASQLTNTNSTTAVDICSAPAASTVRDIDYLSVRNRDTAAATVTVMLDDSSTDYEIVKATLAVGDQLVYTHGDGWRVIASDGTTKTGASGNYAGLSANTFTGVQRWAKGADVASASALTLGTDGNYFDITGTTTITSIGSLGVGTWVKLHFDGALTLTHHATDLVLAGGANITTAAGDEIEFVEYATGDWRMVGGVKADGTAWVASASGRLAPNFVNSSTQIAQRPTAGTLTTSRVVGQCDNIAVWASGGSVSAGTITQITTAVSGTTGYACRAAGVTLTGSGQISHAIRMESLEALKYKNKTASFSVKVDHDVGSAINYTLIVKKANSADNFSAMTTISTSGTTSVSSATGTTVSFDGVSMGDCSNGIELEVQAACGAVTTKNFNCTEFSIDMATTSQTYSAPDYESELLRCQRYLPRWQATSANSELIGMGQCYSTTQAVIEYKYPTRPRTVPTGITISSAGHFNVTTNTAGAANCTGFAFNTAGAFSCSLTATVASGLVAGNATFAFSNNSSASILFTGAELF